jgi:hypothetical protein
MNLNEALKIAGIQARSISDKLSVISKRSREAFRAEIEVAELFAKLDALNVKRSEISERFNLDKSKLSVYIWAAAQSAELVREYLEETNLRSYSANGFKIWVKSKEDPKPAEQVVRVCIPKGLVSDKGASAKFDPETGKFNLPNDPKQRELIVRMARAILNANARKYGATSTGKEAESVAAEIESLVA